MRRKVTMPAARGPGDDLDYSDRLAAIARPVSNRL
jgi:hypothetical protein